VIVVAAYGKILPQSLLDAAKIGCINIHASLLPAYRGAAPIQRALMNGEMETGVTLMKMVLELDAGPMLAQQRIPIEDDDDALSLTNILAVLGADMLIRVLEDVEKTGKIEGEPQDKSKATYAAMITKEEGRVDWSLPTLELMYRLRALTPWPGFYTTINQKRLRIVQAEPLLEGDEQLDLKKIDVEPGTIVGFMPGCGPVVQTGTGFLLITRLQLEGKAQMEATDFMRGYALSAGQRFGVPDYNDY
jgi:methionyl-tRNA formyltransferase